MYVQVYVSQSKFIKQSEQSMLLYYHVYSAVSAVKSDLTSFRPPPISMNFFFVENLCTFRRPQVSLLNPLILLYDSHILPWIIYDWEASAVSAPLNYRWIFLRPRGLKLRNKHGIYKNKHPLQEYCECKNIWPQDEYSFWSVHFVSASITGCFRKNPNDPQLVCWDPG